MHLPQAIAAATELRSTQVLPNKAERQYNVVGQLHYIPREYTMSGTMHKYA